AARRPPTSRRVTGWRGGSRGPRRRSFVARSMSLRPRARRRAWRPSKPPPRFFGASQPDLFRRAAGYVHKILQGTKPAELPVELATKFDLAVNLKTAKAIGLELTPTFIARGEEVIE